MLRNSRGDTIIEVMMSLMIVSMALGFSYRLASNSTRIGQEAHERTEASKLAESQIELMKASVDAGNLFVLTPNSFCMIQNSVNIRNLAAGTPASDAASDGDFSAYHSDCKRSFYAIGIVPSQSGSTYEYAVTVRWDGATGNRQEVKLMYKLVGN
jgi:hypothetical protein